MTKAPETIVWMYLMGFHETLMITTNDSLYNMLNRKNKQALLDVYGSLRMNNGNVEALVDHHE